MKKTGSKTTWKGILTLILTGAAVALTAWKNPAHLADPTFLTTTAVGVTTGVALIQAADNSDVNAIGISQAANIAAVAKQ